MKKVYFYAYYIFARLSKGWKSPAVIVPRNDTANWNGLIPRTIWHYLTFIKDLKIKVDFLGELKKCGTDLKKIFF